MFREICRIEIDDGIMFQPDTVKAEEIRKEANYAGVRVTLVGLLNGARCPVQLDIGFGDAVVPGPEEVQYPVIFGEMAEPHLRVYPRYTVVAEKLEALVSLGMANSRMKDYFDLWILAKHSDFDGAILSQAVRATFERRNTAIPNDVPIGLTEEFVKDDLKEKQWQAFLRKNALHQAPLETVVGQLKLFLLPVLDALTAGASHDYPWRAGTGWKMPLS